MSACLERVEGGVAISVRIAVGQGDPDKVRQGCVHAVWSQTAHHQHFLERHAVQTSPARTTF